jgi:hypothetical protein
MRCFPFAHAKLSGLVRAFFCSNTRVWSFPQPPPRCRNARKRPDWHSPSGQEGIEKQGEEKRGNPSGFLDARHVKAMLNLTG